MASSHGTSLHILGDVRSVLEGRVTEALCSNVPSHTFSFALGAGTFSSLDGLGETLVLAGQPSVCWKGAQGPITETHSTVRSPFLVGVSSMTPDIFLPWDPASPTPLSALYAELLHRCPQGFLMVAYGVFASLKATYIQSAPTKGENINEHSDQYWAPLEEHAQQTACVVAICLPSHATAWLSIEELNRVFYHNPRETSQQTAFFSHSHGALLAEAMSAPPSSSAELMAVISTAQVTGIRHVSSGSTLLRGVLGLFHLTSLAKPLPLP
ncbi:MAG: hypothetical protein ACOYKZ_06595 [Chlamydiia bacterium]